MSCAVNLHVVQPFTKTRDIRGRVTMDDVYIAARQLHLFHPSAFLTIYLYIYLPTYLRHIPILLYFLFLPLREPLAQNAILTQERIDIDIRALQPAVSACRIKLPPAVHDAAVHEHGALALAQRRLPHVCGIVETCSHAARRVDILPQHPVLLDNMGFEGRLERGRPVDVREPWRPQVCLLLEHHGRPRVVIVVSVVLVVERHREGAQCAKEIFGVRADGGGRAERVSEERGATGDRVADAVQELEPGGGLEIEEVHVEGEVEGGVAAAVSGMWGGGGEQYI